MSAEPYPVQARGAVQALRALAEKLVLGPIEASTISYKFLVSVKSYSRGDGPYISVGLLEEQGREVFGDEVVSFLVCPNQGKISIKAQRSWCMDGATVLDVPNGEERALLSAILQVCHNDMDSIRQDPKRALHILDLYARTRQMILDRAAAEPQIQHL